MAFFIILEVVFIRLDKYLAEMSVGTRNEVKKIIKEKANVIPIMSYHSYTLDTKFGEAQKFINEIEEITGNKIIHSIQGAEPIGPKKND